MTDELAALLKAHIAAAAAWRRYMGIPRESRALPGEYYAWVTAEATLALALAPAP